MKNRKPDTGALIVGIATSIFVVFFGIIWTVVAAQAGWFMAIFGIFFVGFAVARLVLTLRHASGNKGASQDNSETNRYAKSQTPKDTPFYCPSCGAKVGADFVYCGECGRKLPERK